MTSSCVNCRSVEHVWWHIRLLYILLSLLVVIYGCSVTWLLTAGVLDPDCSARGQGQGQGPSMDQSASMVDRRVRRSSPRRRSFYRDRRAGDGGGPVESDEWVWMSTYSKIPVCIYCNRLNETSG